MTHREIPKHSELRAFNEAVAGHAGTLCDADGCLFIKPCVEAEISFYQQAFDGSHSALADILPLFMGSLMLHDSGDAPDRSVGGVPPEAQQAMNEFVHRSQASQVSPPTPQQQVQPSAKDCGPGTPSDNITWVPRGSQNIKTDRAIVLGNATHGFCKPNVLDVKLGHRLWADNAPLQKRQRMEEVSRQTTHAKHGFRIAGMRVYEGPEKGYRIFDKDYGRRQINNDNVVDAFRQFLYNPSAGVDAEHSRVISLAFKTDLERVRDVLEQERTRMYSSSLLFVYEGDGEALRAAVIEGNARAEETDYEDELEEEANEKELGRVPVRVVKAAASCEEPLTIKTETFAVDAGEAIVRVLPRREMPSKTLDRSSSRTDSGIVLDDDDLDNSTPVKFGRVEGDDSDNDSELSSMPHIYSLRLIDFAHAHFVAPEEGPDENNLPGVRRLIEIFDHLAQ
ncbi:hypothetical protein SEPCBS57363_002966 [Sporothrix epigloea]|uniref:Kinase n=1 Tax=Sporothrix epigloea TaxID=1892477 RepID=A0ABP0DIW3_9PEZI